ncbi:endonuclease/exonuclease/phosphatase family protein [Sphingomonas bacterium]|uniref:endonuclease/exonuclease/phosphatase family protein n=1 Tax=Sphingomonas bacterium TaxID=1895847 RepID=UPI001575D9BB|nr:endonuclease/exonuclease/phosphatase family protein [Sphingomonas bacterium]
MMKVASYNIHKGVGGDRRCDPARIMDVLGELDADIVALQEVDRRFGTRARIIPDTLIERDGWQVVGGRTRSASMGWHGNAILVRSSAVVSAGATIHLPSLEPRGAVSADVELTGAAVRVVGMHLDLSGLWRRRQAAAILAHIAEDPRSLPSILMGDLNEWSSHSGCLRDFARDHHFAATGPTFHAKRPVGRLDRIMVSRSMPIVDCGVLTSATARKASDHLPIWAVIDPARAPRDDV